MYTEKTEKNRKNYSCEICDFHTSDKSAFTRHCSTRTHKEYTNVDQTVYKKTEEIICSRCGKEYKTRMGLWKHSKKCEAPAKENISVVLLDDDVVNTPPMQNYIMQLVEQNQELKNMFIQQQNDIQHLITNPPTQHITNNNNTNNNNFVAHCTNYMDS